MYETYTLADVTKPGHYSNLTSEHNIGRALDTVNERLAAAVVIVELGLRHGVVDVNRGNLELAITEHLVEVMNAGGGLLGKTADT